jgi:Spy/CpxP family protein refolding chaperone
MNEPRKSRVVAAVVILVVFLAGGMVGFFVHHALPYRGGFHGLAVGGPPGGPPPGIKGRMLARLDRELKLTPEQHTRIDSVLTVRESDLRALMAETRPRFEAIANQTRSEIRSVLTPEQQDEFARLTQRLDARREGRRRAQP